MKNFDIVLIFTNFKRVPSYLCIVKYLSSYFKIGLIRVPIDNQEKTLHSDKIFLDLCVKFGAEFISEKEEISTNILILPQWPYSQEAIDKIQRIVKLTRRRIALCALTWAGVYNEFLAKLKIDKLFIIDKNLFNYLIKQKNLPLFGPKEIIETGMPFEKYPILEETLNIDYLIAMPTPFSFPKEKDKIIFLENIMSLLEDISLGSQKNKVTIKKHNAAAGEYFVNPKTFHLVSCLERFNLTFLLRWLNISPQVKKINSLYARLLHRVPKLERLNFYSNFPLEIFLPFIKKGIIGGLSNTMWGALYFRKPFYNCVPDEVKKRLADRITLKISLDYFGVPCCDGKLNFDPICFDKISTSCRQADLLEIIKGELQGG